VIASRKLFIMASATVTASGISRSRSRWIHSRHSGLSESRIALVGEERTGPACLLIGVVPDADRRVKVLMCLAVEGSLLDA
jgi:hypothetical protein